jgi:predicted dehydrogenase
MGEGKLRTAIVGCKRGAWVGKRVVDLEEYELIAVCDLNRELADGAAGELGGLKVYTDFGAMLEAEEPDVRAEECLRDHPELGEQLGRHL